MTTSAPPSSPTSPAAPGVQPAKRPASGPGPAPAPAAFAALDPMKLLQQYYPFLVAAAVAGAVLGFASFYALRMFYPRWDSEVVFEALPEADSPDRPIGAGNLGDRPEMEAHMNTLAQVMKSDIILGRAVQERIVRDTKWAQRFRDSSGGLDAVEALRKLRKIVSVRPLSDTKIILLRVGTRHKDDAPNIANAIADVFLSDNQTRSSRDMRDLIQKFEEVIRQLSKDLQALEQQRETLLDQAQLSSLRQESTVQQNEVLNLQPAIVAMREEKIMAEEQLKRFEQMANNPGGPVIPESVRAEVDQNPLIAQQDQAISGIKSALRAQKGEFGEGHQEVRRLERRLKAQEAERNALAERLSGEEFQARIENLRNTVKNMEASLSESQGRLEQADRSLQDITAAIKRHEDLTLEYQSKMEKKAEMERRVADMNLMLARGTRVRMLSNAQIPDELAFPKLLPTTAAGVVLVVGIVGGLIALREIREQRVRGPQDVALIPRTKVLGIIPDIEMDPSGPERIEMAARDRSQGIIAESVRQIRHTLTKEAQARGLRSIMFVSGLPASGTSSLLTNIAFNAAMSDLRVLVIDANLRRPAVHSILQMPEAPGVADILLGEATLESAVKSSGIPNLSVLTCGRRDKPVYERFTTPQMHKLIFDAKSAYDLVLVDSTPAVVAGDALALAAHCDAVVLVVRALSEKRGLVARLRNQFSETNAEFLGVVVNAVKASAGGYLRRNFQVAHEYGRNGDDPMGETLARTYKSKDKSKDKKSKSKDAGDTTAGQPPAA